jgi:hypothetical protein
MTHPFVFLQGNLHGQFDWLIHYMTVPLFASAIAAAVLGGKKIRETLLLLVWWFAPFFALALFGKVLYPRFILFMTMPLYVLAAYTIDTIIIRLKKPAYAVLLIAALCFQSVLISGSIISDIKSAVLPRSEIGQYVSDWPSGWGVREIVAILRDESARSGVAVYTEGTFGLLPYALEIYLHDNPRIEIHGVWPPPKSLPEDIETKAGQKTTFYITNLTQTKPDWPMVLVGEYQKGNNSSSHIRLYKIMPKGR